MGNIKTLYLAGKITGDPDYKRKFREAERVLTIGGFAVVNPATLPPQGFEYAAYIRMSAAMLDECDTACFLPDWKDSDGAKLEHAWARAARKTIIYYDEWRQRLKDAAQDAAQGGLEYAT